MAVEIDRSLIGKSTDSYLVEVEKGCIRKFAEAIGDPNPAYRDVNVARSQGYPGIVAPPTFPVTFYPPKEPEWTRNLDRRRILAGEQHFHYSRPIICGDLLSCRIVFKGVEEKLGKSGRIELLFQEIVGFDQSENHVFSHSRVTVYREPPCGKM